MDYHLHTAVTIDGRMTEADACERALSQGIHEIAFTNHVMLTQPDYTISPTALQGHWEKIQACRERYPEIKILIGIEMDYYPDRESEVAATLDTYAQLIGGTFDLVMGAVHDIHGNFFSNKNLAPAFFEGQDIALLYRDYFELATRAAQSRLFDIIAHPDLIKKYTDSLTPYVPYDQYSSSAAWFIDALIDSRVGLEVNTKGLNLPVNETYPSADLLVDYLAKVKLAGIAPIVTLGSDAHKVEDVGFRIRETAQDLKKLGVTALTRFDKREKSLLTLE
jgi:histidinol-phosphatase (PHP family)